MNTNTDTTTTMTTESRIFTQTGDKLTSNNCNIGDITIHPCSNYQLSRYYNNIRSVVLYHNRINTNKRFRIIQVLRNETMPNIQPRYNGNILIIKRFE